MSTLNLTVSGSRQTSNRRLVNGGIFIAAIAAASIIIIVRHNRAIEAQKQYMATVLATVNSDTIRRSDVSAFSSLPAAQALGILVDFKLLDQAAAKQQIHISEQDIERRRQNIVASQHSANYAAAAHANNRTELGMDEQLRHAAILEALAAALIRPVPQSMVHACGVFIKSGGPHAANGAAALRLARSIQSRLDSGYPVAALAKEYTDDGTSKKNNGDLGIVENAIPQPMGFDDDNKLFTALNNASSTGQIKGPVAGDHGYWAVKILSTAANPKTDRPLYEPIRAIWRSYWTQRLEPGIIARLRSQATINPPLNQS